jgi:hypothetical protein
MIYGAKESTLDQDLREWVGLASDVLNGFCNGRCKMFH